MKAQRSALTDRAVAKAGLSRRELLYSSALALLLRGSARALGGAPGTAGGALRGLEPLGVLPFLDEGDLWVRMVGTEERRFGSGLGGRKIFELGTLTPAGLIVPSERFFLRTFHPDDLGDAAGWTVRIDGLVRKPVEIPIEVLAEQARPRGEVLVECSGNSGEHYFGLISAARWEGVSVASILARAAPRAEAAAIEVVGDDTHAMPSLTSTPGASWIFTREQLTESGAFFATGMNGTRLLRDHGFPVRLIVPGWYGCACIKWVRSLRFVAGDALSSSQMREFAARTQQRGVPERAPDFAPATIDPAAMPVRVEAWRGEDGTTLAIVGIAWGGSAPGQPRPRRWSIRCGEGPWRPLRDLGRRSAKHTWRLWSFVLRGAPAGRMEIRLRVDDPGIRTRRLDRGYYARTVDVPRPVA